MVLRNQTRVRQAWAQVGKCAEFFPNAHSHPAGMRDILNIDKRHAAEQYAGDDDDQQIEEINSP